MTTGDPSREEFLARLEDLLPTGEIARVRADVESLILDRAADERDRDPELGQEEAERRAVRALGTPEALAEELVSEPLTIGLATQRSFVRLLAAVFACHLLLSIALTVAGSRTAPIPGLLGPLPREPFAAVLLSVLTIFLIDAGAMLVLFVALGRSRGGAPLPGLFRPARWTRRGAVEGLVLIALLAVLFNVFLENIFSVKQGDLLETFLAREFLALVPWLNVALAFFAARHILTLLGRGGGSASLFADALGALAGSAWLITASTRAEIVQMPTGHKLGQEAADVLDHLLESVFLIVFVVGALLLIVRFVRSGIAWRRSLRRR
ncbi:MAG: hypothetical protein O2894_04870 [Planctomycetota bacterium]|nr:hypothetical protein [Planctomycetota bacterium]